MVIWKKYAKFCCLSVLFRMWLGFWKDGEFYLLKITRFSLIVPGFFIRKKMAIFITSSFRIRTRSDA